MNNLEIEVKYHVADMAAVRERAIELGAVPGHPRHFETNIRFEDSSRSLIKNSSLLRLRQDTKCTLTFKGEPDPPDKNDAGVKYKIHKEIETEVADFDATRRILESIGFFPEQVYEKYRETLVYDDALICLDTMPYGDFLEIEGDKTSIRQLTDTLGFCWEKRILANYLAMFEFIKAQNNLTFTDVTFDTFKDTDFKLSECLTHFEYGSD